jgi:uncharacterized protein (DUF433 family)
MTFDVLEREMYSEAEAARLLGLRQSSLSYWLEGGVRRGKTYSPVIRQQAKGGHPPVTWAEFVEAGWLRSYRRADVPMRELRSFIEYLRDRLGVPYPLADRRPFVSARDLLYQAQEEAGLSTDFVLIAPHHGQYMLTPAPEQFFRRVTWDGDLAAGWCPSEDPASPVRIDPDTRFGQPAIKGIATEVIREHYEAGEGDGEIARDFGLTAEDVVWALAYEQGARAAA